MLIWKKFSKIYLDCFTSNHVAYKQYPITKAIKQTPIWWKLIPRARKHAVGSIQVDMPTIKMCQGIIDLYKQGFVLPLWSDLIVEISKENKSINWYFADKITKMQQHNSIQFDPAFKNYGNLKIISPWHIVEKTGIKFIYLPCTWSILELTDGFNQLPGVLDFKYQTSTHINILVNRHWSENYQINAGTPTVQFIPISDKEIIIKNHIVSEEELNNIRGASIATPKFIGNYLETKKRCPFHHNL